MYTLVMSLVFRKQLFDPESSTYTYLFVCFETSTVAGR